MKNPIQIRPNEFSIMENSLRELNAPDRVLVALRRGDLDTVEQFVHEGIAAETAPPVPGVSEDAPARGITDRPRGSWLTADTTTYSREDMEFTQAIEVMGFDSDSMNKVRTWLSGKNAMTPIQQVESLGGADSAKQIVQIASSMGRFDIVSSLSQALV